MFLSVSHIMGTAKNFFGMVNFRSTTTLFFCGEIVENIHEFSLNSFIWSHNFTDYEILEKDVGFFLPDKMHAPVAL